MNDRGESSTSGGSSNVVTIQEIKQQRKSKPKDADWALKNNLFVSILCFCILLKIVM